MLRTTIILLFCCIGYLSNGQDLKLFEEVKMAFSKSKTESNYGKGKFMWSACNLDSSFYKSDTILLIDNHSYLLNDCTETADVFFHSLNKCYITESQTSKVFGTSKSRIASKKDLFNFNIRQFDNDVFATWYNAETRREFKFRVVSVENIGSHGLSVTKLKLLRLK